jgi:hypothetical protein
MALFDMTQVRLIQNGEPHDETTYNRPILDVGQQVSQIIQDFDTLISSSALISDITQPSILSTTNGQADFTSYAESSPFEQSVAFYGIHEISEWQLSESPDFSVLIDSYVGSANLTTWAFTGVTSGRTYFLRVRYGSDSRYSSWSDTVYFTTSSTYIEVPIVTVSGFPDSVPLSPTISGSPFNVINGTDNHASSNWGVYENNVLIWSSLSDTVNKTSIVVPTGVIEDDKTYRFTLSYNGEVLGTSAEFFVVASRLWTV